MAQQQPNQKLNIEELIIGILISLKINNKDTSWENLQRRIIGLTDQIQPNTLKLAQAIYNTSPLVAKLLSLPHAELLALCQQELTSQKTYAFLAQASQEELECLVALSITSFKSHCTLLLVHQHLTSAWPELLQPSNSQLLTKFEQILNTPKTQLQIEQQNSINKTP